MECRVAEFGGYFGLELPFFTDYFSNAIKLQSGRAAIRLAIESTDIKHVYLPAFICDSVIQAVLDAGAEPEFYSLDDSLYPQGILGDFNNNSILLYVNHFGLCDRNIDKLIQDISPENLIIDNSQALFSPQYNNLATVYSVRKFVGVPDGGLLFLNKGIKVKLPSNEDIVSLERIRHLFIRTAYSAKEGYNDYLESENSLSDTRPLKMSRLTQRLMRSINFDDVRQKRRENFIKIASKLDEINLHKWQLDTRSVPLCYPLLLTRDVSSIRECLANKGIYIPTYWPDAYIRIRDDSCEEQFINKCLAIPCDQRYSEPEIDVLLESILEHLI